MVFKGKWYPASTPNTSYAEGKDVGYDVDDVFALADHCSMIDRWSETDESTKLSWADVSEPSDVRSETEDSTKFSCENLIDEHYDGQEFFETGWKTPSSLASDDDFGDPDMFMHYTTSAEAMCPVMAPPMMLPMSYEGMCDLAAMNPTCYDFSSSVDMCSGTGIPSAGTACKHNSSSSTFHFQVCEALAAEKVHEQLINQVRSASWSITSKHSTIMEGASADSFGADEANNSSSIVFSEQCTEQLEDNHAGNMFFDAAFAAGCSTWPYVAYEGTLDNSNQCWLECGFDKSPRDAEFYQWHEANLPSSGLEDTSSVSHWNVPRNINWYGHNNEAEDTEEITTFMMHNVPNEYSRTVLIEHLDNIGLHGKIDLLYVPIDRHTKQNVGYAFVNFVDAAAAAEGVRLLTSHGICRTRRRVPRPSHHQLWLSPAHLQGFQKNVDHYRKTSSKPLVRVNGRWTDVLPASSDC